MITDTIVAIATALQVQAISIIRISGSESIEIASKLMKKDLSKEKSHTIHYGYIYDNDLVVDEVLVSIFKAPRTFTREDVIEINCHGGIFVTNRILQLVIENGARLSKEGEFTERAFLNGRIDLTEAESILDVIDARYENESSMALQGLQGKIKKKIHELKDDLVGIIAQLEVNIDYPEYDDVEILTTDILIPKTNSLLKKIDDLIIDSKEGQLIKHGIKTAIIGKPNVGKSSLLNSLINENKAIVTDVAGTTRDVVEGEIVIGNIKLLLNDTAGIRSTTDIVEQIGIDKSRQVLNDSDLILMIIDASTPLSQDDLELIELIKDKNHIIVKNKSDLTPVVDIDGISISAKNDDLDSLISEIRTLFGLKKIVNDSKLLIYNQRHITLIKKAKHSLEDALKAMRQGMEVDFIIVDLNDAYYQLKEILGEEAKLDLLDEIFSRFCLGK